jgi:carbon monoxide dehydrogenase subunit G
MDMRGTQQFSAAPQAVWDALHDAGKLQQCIPGAQQVSWVDATTLAVRAAVDLGPLTGSGEVRAHVQEQTAPNRLAVQLVAEGRRLSATGPLTIDLVADGAGTVLTYAGNVALGGLAGMLDNPLTRPMVERGVAQFFANLAQRV